MCVVPQRPEQNSNPFRTYSDPSSDLWTFGSACAPVWGAASRGGDSWLSWCKERHLPAYPVNCQLPSSSSSAPQPPAAFCPPPLSVRSSSVKCAHFAAPLSVIRRRRGSRGRRKKNKRKRKKKSWDAHGELLGPASRTPFSLENVMDFKCLSASFSAGATRRKRSACAASL